MPLPALKVTCPAKINPYLRIVRRRDDGFHDLETVFLAVTLFDTLEIRPSEKRDCMFEVKGEFGDEIRNQPPESNLVAKAWRLVCDRLQQQGVDTAAWPKGIEVSLVKDIPVGAGLGGGSADAAGALQAFSHWVALQYGEDVSDELDLPSLALQLGSDVPFFLTGGLALGEGQGERLKPVPLDFRLPYLLLIKPGFSINTGSAYSTCTPEGPSLQPMEQIVRSWSEGASAGFPEMWGYNSFYESKLPHFRALEGIRESCISNGAEGVYLSGSGSAMVAWSWDDAAISGLQQEMQRQQLWSKRVEPCEDGVLVSRC